MSNILKIVDLTDHAIRRAVFALLDGLAADHRALARRSVDLPALSVIRSRTGATMTPVKVCSICTGAIVGFGNDVQPINDGRCCDRCHAERVIPERVRRMLERDAKREGNGGALQ